MYRMIVIVMLSATLSATVVADDGRSVFPARAEYVRHEPNNLGGGEYARDLAHADFNADGLVGVSVSSPRRLL